MKTPRVDPDLLTFLDSGQLCTDLEEVIQAKYHAQIFNVLIPTLEAPEPRYVPIAQKSQAKPNEYRSVHSHAAAALINFCEGVERDTMVPYLDAIVERLLKLLEPQYGKDGKVRSYVQEQAVTTLAMVADVSEVTFAKVCFQTSLYEILYFLRR